MRTPGWRGSSSDLPRFGRLNERRGEVRSQLARKSLTNVIDQFTDRNSDAERWNSRISLIVHHKRSITYQCLELLLDLLDDCVHTRPPIWIARPARFHNFPDTIRHGMSGAFMNARTRRSASVVDVMHDLNLEHYVREWASERIQLTNRAHQPDVRVR